MATSTNVSVGFPSIATTTWMSSPPASSPIASFNAITAIPFGNVIVTNAVNSNFVTVNASSFGGTAVGVTTTSGNVQISATPMGWLAINAGSMPVPIYGFTPSMRDIALEIELYIESES